MKKFKIFIDGIPHDIVADNPWLFSDAAEFTFDNADYGESMTFNLDPKSVIIVHKTFRGVVITHKFLRKRI